MRTITIIINDETKKIDVVVGGQMSSRGAAEMCRLASWVFEEKVKTEKIKDNGRPVPG